MLHKTKSEPSYFGDWLSVLVPIFRSLITALRRSIDVDLPIACDDEYWLNPDPNLAFKQPEGKPSIVTFFNCALRLAQINAFALRTIVRISALCHVVWSLILT